MKEPDKPLSHAAVAIETAITTAIKITLATTGLRAFLAFRRRIEEDLVKILFIIYEFKINIKHQPL